MMKKLLIALCLSAVTTLSFGQTKENSNENSNQQTEITSIKPADGTPAVFSTQEQLDAKIADKIENIKEMIKNETNPELILRLREELWRFENAVVAKK